MCVCVCFFFFIFYTLQPYLMLVGYFTVFELIEWKTRLSFPQSGSMRIKAGCGTGKSWQLCYLIMIFGSHSFHMNYYLMAALLSVSCHECFKCRLEGKGCLCLGQSAKINWDHPGSQIQGKKVPQNKITTIQMLKLKEETKQSYKCNKSQYVWLWQIVCVYMIVSFFLLFF